MKFRGFSQNKINIFEDIKMFKKKQSKNRYSFKNRRKMKTINMDHSTASEYSNLIEN